MAGTSSERRFVCFKGELTDEQFQSIFAQNICYGVLDENAIIAITDVKGVIKYANHSFVKLSKYLPTEIVGANPVLVRAATRTAVRCRPSCAFPPPE